VQRQNVSRKIQNLSNSLFQVDFLCLLLLLLVCHLLASSNNNSPISTNPSRTKVTAQELIRGVADFRDANDSPFSYMYPLLGEYGNTFEPSISDPTESPDALQTAT
jgi:hypothetical protein